jgi:hypothetical protein
VAPTASPSAASPIHLAENTPAALQQAVRDPAHAGPDRPGIERNAAESDRAEDHEHRHGERPGETCGDSFAARRHAPGTRRSAQAKSPSYCQMKFAVMPKAEQVLTVAAVA